MSGADTIANPEPTWPTDRGLERYIDLLGLDIKAVLKGGGTWIEIGPGTDALPMRPFLRDRSVSLIAIGPHPRALPDRIKYVEGFVPTMLPFLEFNRTSASLVTDVYGAISYYDDPLAALLYEALLINKRGVLATFTELKRFGALDVWDRISRFFRSTMKQSVSFQTTCVVGDASKTEATCLRILVNGASAGTQQFPRLLDLAYQKIGRPSPSSILWRADDESAAIRQVDYCL